MTVETKIVQVTNVPAEALDYLRPHSERAGHGTKDAGVARYAILELERRIKEERQSGHPQRVA